MDVNNVETRQQCYRARKIVNDMGFTLPKAAEPTLQLYAALCDFDDAFKVALKAQILDKKTAKSGKTVIDMFDLMEDVVKRHSAQ